MRARRPTQGKRDSDIGPTEAEQTADLLARGLFGTGNPSDGILAAEAAGQEALVREAVLPQEGLTKKGFGIDDPFVPAGLVIEGDHDDLFVNVTLPEGWEKARTSHSMWSDLLDAKGRKRAGIFYKAAFYDRSANISWNPRYRVRSVYLDDDGIRVQIEDAEHKGGGEEGHGPVLHVIGEVAGVPPEAPHAEKLARYERKDAMHKEAIAWLTERRPQWRNPAAYWDDTEVPA